jgi:hypothetical protein
LADGSQKLRLFRTFRQRLFEALQHGELMGDVFRGVLQQTHQLFGRGHAGVADPSQNPRDDV